MSVQLGDKVTDSITGITGTAVSRHDYLYGCVTFGVELLGADGKPETYHFDEQRLTSEPSATSGGPQIVPPARPRP